MTDNVDYSFLRTKDFGDAHKASEWGDKLAEEVYRAGGVRSKGIKGVVSYHNRRKYVHEGSPNDSQLFIDSFNDRTEEINEMENEIVYDALSDARMHYERVEEEIRDGEKKEKMSESKLEKLIARFYKNRMQEVRFTFNTPVDAFAKMIIENLKHEGRSFTK